MEDDYKNKHTHSGVGNDQNLHTEENRQELQQLLLHLTEEKVATRFSDPNIDREHEKITLLNGSEITLGEFKKMQTVVTPAMQNPGPQFERDYYREIFRLKGWTYVEGQREKPWPIADYTNELIYGRYAKEVLPSLQQLNPYIGNGIRGHYHYQHLTQHGLDKLQEFISDAIKVMKTCTSWYEFRVKMFNQFGVPYQVDFFEENGEKRMA